MKGTKNFPFSSSCILLGFRCCTTEQSQETIFKATDHFNQNPYVSQDLYWCDQPCHSSSLWWMTLPFLLKSWVMFVHWLPWLVILCRVSSDCERARSRQDFFRQAEASSSIFRHVMACPGMEVSKHVLALLACNLSWHVEAILLETCKFLGARSFYSEWH